MKQFSSSLGVIALSRELASQFHGLGGGVADNEGAERAVGELQYGCGGILDRKAARLAGSDRLHALDLADDHAQAIDVVDRIDQDRSAARLAPPCHIVIVVWLAVQPGAVRGDDLSERPACDENPRRLHDRVWRR